MKPPTKSESVLDKDDIELLVRKAVEERFEKENQLLRSSIVLAVKIVGGAIAVFFAIFTLLGISTWGDIKKQAIAVVGEKAEDLVQKADSDTNIGKRLNNLLNQAIVSAELASLARKGDAEVELNDNDWKRLRAWLKEEELDIQSFSDALVVLNAQSRDRKGTDVHQLLSEMLNPPDQSPYAWIYRQPEKLSAILANFKSSALGPSAVELVASNRLTDSLRADAADYVLEVEYADGVDKLLKVYEGNIPGGHTKQSALFASISLQPDNPRVLAVVSALVEGEESPEKVTTLARLISAVSSQRLKVDSTVNIDKLKELGTKALLYCNTHGVYFELQPSAVDPFKRRPPEAQHVAMWLSTVETSASGIDDLSTAEFQKLDIYWRTLANLANANDISRFRDLILRPGIIFGGLVASPGNDMAVLMAADASGSLLVQLEDGSRTELPVQDLKQLTILGTEGARYSSGGDPLVTWSTGENAKASASLIGFKGSGFKFWLDVPK